MKKKTLEDKSFAASRAWKTASRTRWKGSAQVGGVQGCRPVSLYEVILKVATGIVHRKMKAIMARQHLLNNRQIFNVHNRGVHDALQLVLGALSRAISQGKAVYVVSTDVAGAFPSVPLL